MLGGDIMESRLELQDLLKSIIGNQNVYYDPPSSMDYPAIQYNKQDIESKYANNKAYARFNCYSVTVISEMPDEEAIIKLLDLPMCSYDTHYTSDGLHHDVLKLYY